MGRGPSDPGAYGSSATFQFAFSLLGTPQRMINSLGSVLGDLLAGRWGLGLAASRGMYAAMLAAVWALERATRIDRRLPFWAAFVPSRIPF